MSVAGQPIEKDQLATLEAHFRRAGLPELSRNVARARMTLTEAFLGLPIVLLYVGFLVAYYWTAVPRWVWPILFAASAFFEFQRQDIQRARLSNLSGASLLVITVLYSVIIGLWIWHGVSGPYLPIVLIAAVQLLRAVVGAGLVPVRLVGSLFEGVLSARQVAAAIPAMLAVVLFVFMLADTWKLFGLMDRSHFISGLVGVSIIILAILWMRLRAITRQLAEPTRDWVINMAPATEADTFLRQQIQLPDSVARLPSGARRNIANALTILAFTRLVGASAVIVIFFVLIGVLIIDPAQTQTFLGNTHYISLVSARISGHPYLLSSSLIKVAAWLAALSALYYAIVGLEDYGALEAFIRDELNYFRGIVASWVYYDAAVDSFEVDEVLRHASPQVESEDAARDSIGVLLNEGARKLDAGDADGAEKCWLQELNSPEHEVRRKALFNLGMLYGRAGMRLKAKEYYEQAAYVGDAMAAYNLSGILWEDGKKEEAKELLRRIINGDYAECDTPGLVEQKARRTLKLAEKNRIWEG